MRNVLIFFFAVLPVAGMSQHDAAQKKAEQAVLRWADNTFKFYDAPRFEKFEALPSPDYYALQMQKEALIEFKDEIIFNFGEGKSDRTAETLAKDTIQLNENIAQMDMIMASFEPKFDNYEILFWANIETNNGLTVYYQHRMKLDANFKVISGKIIGRVGQENDQVKIVYKD